MLQIGHEGPSKGSNDPTQLGRPADTNGGVWDLGFWPDPQQTYLFNADGENNEVRVLKRADGTVLGAFGRSGRQAGQFHWVHNLAVDSKGDIYTTEVDNGKRVQKFRPVNRGP